MRLHFELLHKALQKVPALKDTILLLKRWAVARSFLFHQNSTEVYTPLNGFCLSILAAHACQTSNVAASQTSSFQLFKLTLSVLASTDWASQKLTFGVATATPLSDPEKRMCGAHFYDTDGLFNFFWRLGPFIGEIRWEAKRALKLLDAQADPYEAIFGQQAASPVLQWDLAVRTQALKPSALSPMLLEVPEGQVTGLSFGERMPADSPEALAFATRLAELLREGLGDRCLRAVARLVGSSSTANGGGIAVVVGITLEAMNLEQAVDRGPATDSAEALRFRHLWGAEKSELRRFKDGSVLECAVWAKPPSGRAIESKKQPAVVTQIVRHLLQRHFPEVAQGASVVAGPTGFVQNLGLQEQRLWVSFDAFRSHLCQLSSLPLTIKDLHPVDACFSYTATTPRPAPVVEDGVARTVHEVIIEFEASGRWPDDPEAAKRVAGAMLLQIKEELQTDLGIEADVTEGFLDVRYPEFVFRARIFHQHELENVAFRVTSMKQETGAMPGRPNAPKAQVVLPGEEELERFRMLWWRPRVRTAMHSHVLQMPALAGAARLCQRWFASQLLSGYEEFVEHLVGAAFLHPAPFDVPTSPQVGLCRVCWLLDAYDWEQEPLIIDWNERVDSEDRLAMRQSFEKSRAEAAGITPFWICSRFDPHCLLLRCPPATVSAWLRRRAKQALAVCHQRLLGLSMDGICSAGWDALFAVDTSVFDVMVRLRAPMAVDKSNPKEAKRAAASSEAFDTLVEKIRTNLSAVCLVFYDVHTRVIALKWRPSAFFPQPQNVLMCGVPHTMIVQPEGPPLCVPNVLYLTSAIASLAEGLAAEVTLVRARDNS